MIQTWKIVYQAYGKYKWRIALLVVLGFVSGLAESTGIAALIPLFSFLVNNSAQEGDFVSRFMLTFFNYFSLPFNLETVLGIIVFLFLIRGVSTLAFHYTRTRFIVDYRSSVMKEILGAMLGASWPFLLQQKLGHLQNTFLRSVQQGILLLTALTQAISATTAFAVYLAVALAIDYKVTLLTVGIGIILVLFLRPLVGRSRAAAHIMRDFEKETAQHVSEHVIGMKMVKALGVKEEVFKGGERLINEFGRYNLKAGILRSLGIDFIQPLSLVFIAILFAFLYRDPGFNLGVFIATIYLVQKIFVKIETTQRISHSLAEFIPYTADIVELQKNLLAHKEEDAGNKPFVFKEKLEFLDVAFQYNYSKEVLRAVSFVLPRGGSVGLIGPSGSGKTSIADLILRLFNPSWGSITLDGTNIKEIDMNEWRKRVGYVSQEPFLLNGTIMENIRFYDDGISDMDAVEAARLANAYNFIDALPRKFETLVGERGVLLSAGQRQRIALARVLARRPEILILDEATSALDNESELFIQQAINALKGKVTVFTIAHRLSTILDTDHLLVLDGGFIRERGSPEELLEKKESYLSKMYHLKEL